MKQEKFKDHRWIVVQVWRGIPIEVEIYATLRTARRRERILRQSMNPHENEVGVFKAPLCGGRGKQYPSVAAPN
jgi:hypothetical protein